MFKKKSTKGFFLSGTIIFAIIFAALAGAAASAADQEGPKVREDSGGYVAVFGALAVVLFIMGLVGYFMKSISDSKGEGNDLES